MKYKTYILLIASLVLGFSLVVAGAPNGKGKSKQHKSDKSEVATEHPEDQEEKLNEEDETEEAQKSSKTKKFSERDKKIIEDFFEQAQGGQWRTENKLPPGLQKKYARTGTLPTGWQKKLELGKPLPEDIAKKAVSLPDALKKQLPPEPEGTETVMIEDEIVRIAKKTREVIDAVYGLGNILKGEN